MRYQRLNCRRAIVNSHGLAVRRGLGTRRPAIHERQQLPGVPVVQHPEGFRVFRGVAQQRRVSRFRGQQARECHIKAMPLGRQLVTGQPTVRSRQIKDQRQGQIHAPLLLGAEMPDKFAKACGIDCTGLFDQNVGR